MNRSDLTYLQDTFGKELFPSELVTKSTTLHQVKAPVAVSLVLGTIMTALNITRTTGVLRMFMVALTVLLVITLIQMYLAAHVTIAKVTLELGFTDDEDVGRLIELSKELRDSNTVNFTYNITDERVFREITWDNFKARNLLHTCREFKELLALTQKSWLAKSQELKELQGSKNESVAVAASTLDVRRDDVVVITYKYLENELTLTYTVAEFSKEVTK